jgi:hypothetical protein
VRLIPLLLLACVVAACGSTSEEIGTPASSEPLVETTLPAETVPAAEDPLGDKLKPPAIALKSRAGEQRAAQGSYCVDFVDQQTGTGQGVCADSAGPIAPERVSDVNAGEEVTLLVEDAILTTAARET